MVDGTTDFKSLRTVVFMTFMTAPDLMFLKALALTVFKTVEVMLIVLSFEQFLNAFLPIVVTPVLIVTLVRFLHLLKAPCPMETVFLRMITCLMQDSFLKALTPILVTL